MSSPIADPIQAGLAAGLKVIDASTLSEHRSIEADVAIIGSGAEGGVSAEILTLAGLHVVLIEEGPLKSSTDFKMREADAYPALYQESAARKTKDKAINILKVVPSAARPPSTGPPVSVPPTRCWIIGKNSSVCKITQNKHSPLGSR